MKAIRKIIAGIVLFYAPLQTMAWGTNGHRISGQIAENHLSEKAKAAIKAVLGNESIAMASNWGDFIKSDPNFKSYDPWHYIDLEDIHSRNGLTAYLKNDTTTNLYSRVTFLTAQLKKKTTTKANKLLYLKMLIHLVEDMHQPLHTTGHESGGNGIKLKWFNEETNLHTIWDSKLINFQELSYTEYVRSIDFTTKAQIKKWQSTSVSDWLYESNVLADKITAEAKPGQTLSYNYNFKYKEILNQQLLKGGVRLAGLLNQIFG